MSALWSKLHEQILTLWFHCFSELTEVLAAVRSGLLPPCVPTIFHSANTNGYTACAVGNDVAGKKKGGEDQFVGVLVPWPC